MRRTKFWYAPLFISTLLAAFGASAQPQAIALADLQHPQNFPGAVARAQALTQHRQFRDVLRPLGLVPSPRFDELANDLAGR